MNNFKKIVLAVVLGAIALTIPNLSFAMLSKSKGAKNHERERRKNTYDIRREKTISAKETINELRAEIAALKKKDRLTEEENDKLIRKNLLLEGQMNLLKRLRIKDQRHSRILKETNKNLRSSKEKSTTSRQKSRARALGRVRRMFREHEDLKYTPMAEEILEFLQSSNGTTLGNMVDGLNIRLGNLQNSYKRTGLPAGHPVTKLHDTIKIFLDSIDDEEDMNQTIIIMEESAFWRWMDEHPYLAAAGALTTLVVISGIVVAVQMFTGPIAAKIATGNSGARTLAGDACPEDQDCGGMAGGGFCTIPVNATYSRPLTPSEQFAPAEDFWRAEEMEEEATFNTTEFAGAAETPSFHRESYSPASSQALVGSRRPRQLERVDLRGLEVEDDVVVDACPESQDCADTFGDFDYEEVDLGHFGGAPAYVDAESMVESNGGADCADFYPVQANSTHAQPLTVSEQFEQAEDFGRAQAMEEGGDAGLVREIIECQQERGFPSILPCMVAPASRRVSQATFRWLQSFLGDR